MGNKGYFSWIVEDDSERTIRLRKFLFVSFLVLLAVNLPLISAYLVLTQAGSFTLYPDEDYIINIPFISADASLASICGSARKTNGVALSGVNVTLKLYNNESDYAKNVSDNNGKFCFSVDIDSNQKFDFYVEYDNSSLILGSNDYDLDFDNYKVYDKSTDNYAFLSGKIVNEDATIENGRFEIKMGQYVNGSWKYTFGDYEKFLVNISANSVYNVPSNALNFSKSLVGLDVGEYKFLIKSSFNGEEKSSVYVFFNITD